MKTPSVSGRPLGDTYTLLALVALLALSAVASTILLLKNSSTTSSVLESGELKISNSDGSRVITYSLANPSSLSGRIFQVERQSGDIKQGGVLAVLHYLEERDYRLYGEQVVASHSCPAGFYNAHMKHVFLFAADDACRSYIEKMTSTEIETWPVFSLAGNFLTFKRGISPSGDILQPGGDYRMFLLTGECNY